MTKVELYKINKDKKKKPVKIYETDNAPKNWNENHVCIVMHHKKTALENVTIENWENVVNIASM